MNKTKTIILGLIALAFLVGVVWYGFQNQDAVNKQKASALESGQEVSFPKVTSEFVLGSPEAPVTMIEYSSHFCGHCIDFHNNNLPLLMDKYIKTGQVKLISRFVSPLEVNLAIICAQEENKFSEYSGYLFDNIDQVQSIDDLKTVAGQVGLNQTNFDQCFDTKRYENRANVWFDQATEAGVSGTPTFFVNDQEIVGNQPISVFEQAIEQALAQ